MNNKNITVFDRIKEGIKIDSIVFDKYDAIHTTYKIPKDLVIAIYSTFSILFPDSDKRYSSLYENHNYDKSNYLEELIDGPIKYTVYNNINYPKGVVHRIDIEGMSYSMVANSQDILVSGSYTNFYTTKSNNKIVDTVGLAQYQIRYGGDGMIKSIVVNYRATEKYRDGTSVLHDIGYKRFEFANFDDFIEFRDKLVDYDYAINLLNNEREKRM